MNLWAAIVRIVELFLRGGRPGFALTIVLALGVMLTIVATAGLTFGRTSVEGLVTATTGGTFLHQTRNQGGQ